jgi:hypothetical protein
VELVVDRDVSNNNVQKPCYVGMNISCYVWHEHKLKQDIFPDFNNKGHTNEGIFC